ncbi:MAG: hypothetical protein VW577_02300 [Pelagibacteraceae bacterium]
MISKSAKQPMEGIASAAAPSAAAEGSNGPNVTGGMKKGAGYMNQGAPSVMGGFRTGDNKPGARGAISKGVSVASEDVTKGMGGKVIKDMQ